MHSVSTRRMTQSRYFMTGLDLSAYTYYFAIILCNLLKHDFDADSEEVVYWILDFACVFNEFSMFMIRRA